MYGRAYVVALASLLAGASVVHYIAKPDLVRGKRREREREIGHRPGTFPRDLLLLSSSRPPRPLAPATQTIPTAKPPPSA